MNTYGILILCAMVGKYVLDLAADILNLSAMNSSVPKEFEDVYDAEKYHASQEYTRVNTRFGVVTATVNLIITLVFWFAGGFNALDGLVRGWNLPLIMSGVAYIGILVFLWTVISLPFTLYDTFVIEERFGFNTTTILTFFTDLLKELALSIVLGVPLLAGIMAFFQYAGSSAWVYCWMATTLFMLIVQFIAPTWIMPIFNTFTPLEDGELRDSIFAYARSVGFSLDNLFVMDGSKRSTKSNAFFTGFGKQKRIALFDTLIEKHSVAQLVAILAHEIGHYKKKHVLKNMILAIVHAGVMFFLLSVFLSHQGLFDAFYMEHASVYAGLIFFGMLFSPIEAILSIALQYVSRQNEYDADRFAVETTKASAPFIQALKTLSVHNLSI